MQCRCQVGGGGGGVEEEGERRGDLLSQLASFSILDETRNASSAISSVLKTAMYVFLTIHNCYHIGVYPTQQTHTTQTFIFEKSRNPVSACLG